MVRDRITIRNERIKLFAAFSSNMGLGLIGFAVLRRLADSLQSADAVMIWWLTAGLAFHGAAHYITGYIRKEDTT